MINLEECVLEDGPESKENGADDPNAKSSKSKKSNAAAEKEDPTAVLIFRVSHKVSYKTVLKGIASLHITITCLAFLRILHYTCYQQMIQRVLPSGS